MKVPILNIYYLLCYAWSTDWDGEVIDLGSQDFRELVDLFAKLLNEDISRLISHGLDRDYFTIEEEIRGVKGKLDLSTTVKRSLLQNGQTHCVFDELSYDVPQNQILKSTLRLLTMIDSLDKSEKERSERLYMKLGTVSDVRLAANMFRTVRIHRNNQLYRSLLHLCRMIYENTLVNEEEGTVQFLDFRENDQTLGTIFERFVREFCRRNTACKVAAPQIEWHPAKGTKSALQSLPKMQTDILLKSKERTIIIDTKCYSSPLIRRYDQVERVISKHLYQIFAYVTNWATKSPEDVSQLEGWLLYAAVDRDFDLHFEIAGRRIRVCSINLSHDWPEIETNLLNIVHGTAPEWSES